MRPCDELYSTALIILRCKGLFELNRLNLKITAMLTVTLSLMFIAAPLAATYGFSNPAIYGAICSAFATFIIFLEIRQERVPKGMLLILSGVFFQLIYSKFLLHFIDMNTSPYDAINYLEIFGQVLLLACSGAGGSIIAAHADRSSSDIEDRPAHPTVIDNTKHIEKVIELVNAQNKKISTLLATSVVSIAIAVSALMILLIR